MSFAVGLRVGELEMREFLALVKMPLARSTPLILRFPLPPFSDDEPASSDFLSTGLPELVEAVSAVGDDLLSTGMDAVGAGSCDSSVAGDAVSGADFLGEEPEDPNILLRRPPWPGEVRR